MEIKHSLVANAKTAAVQVWDQAGSLVESLRDKVVCWFRNLNLTPANMIEIGSYLAGGFIIGFLLKKYFRLGVILIVLLIAAGWVLVEFDVITINWNNAQNLAHVAPNDTIKTVIVNLAQWCKQHLTIVISGIVGFLLGHKVG